MLGLRRRASGSRSRDTPGCSASSSSRWGPRRGARASETLVRAPQYVHVRAGNAVELGDLLEALIATGELDEADAILERWERARRRARPSLGAGDPRARPGLAPRRARRSRGRVRELRGRTRRARTEQRPLPSRADAARARTDATTREAAPRRPRDARRSARDLRTPRRATLGRADAGGTGAHRRPHTTGDELTEAERRIAALVAEGRTNREVAAELFLTVHSVETALTRVYRKLGVRSRAELASRHAAKT